jgi:hypothetical protein
MFISLITPFLECISLLALSSLPHGYCLCSIVVDLRKLLLKVETSYGKPYAKICRSRSFGDTSFLVAYRSDFAICHC